MGLTFLISALYNFLNKVVTPLLPVGTKRRDFVYRRLLDSYHAWNRSLKKARYILRSVCIPIGRGFYDSTDEDSTLKDYESLCERIHATLLPTHFLPSITVISVLYDKEKEIKHYLDSFLGQDYPGEVEIILVDDLSTDGSVDVVSEYLGGVGESSQLMSRIKVMILRNQENIGNCRSRNRGIARAKGDILVVIDADCIVNRGFLLAHAYAHLLKDCEVVVGPMNLETNGEEPLSVLTSYESAPESALRDSQLQDTVNRQSFLNCITRNFSIRREFITEELFDPLFSYSKGPSSGFGWEDVEMGYRLYKRGARIKFIPNAISVHISHPAAVDEGTKAGRSLLNFRRLHEKHPELVFVARRWTMDTYRKICGWLDSHDLPVNEDRKFLDNRFERFLPVPISLRKKRPLRILTFRWHCPHQYELYKLPHEFTLATGISSGFTNAWEYGQRPLMPNARLRPVEEINPRHYDLAIIHFDENILAPENTNGVIPAEWGANAKWFIKNVKIPTAAICHGTPQFHEQYTSNFSGAVQVIEKERIRVVDFFKDTLVICNSYQAQREWGFRKSKVIWHGFDPAEFPPALYKKGILTLGKAMRERPHYRGYFLYQKVFDNFPEEFMPEPLEIPEPHFFYEKGTNPYSYAKFRSQIDAVREYSIYFNPTLRSPMPRSRDEAMMCGLAIVSANNHDVELFVKNGVNGFYSNEPEELREYLLYLLKNPEKMRQIGMAGRSLAMDIFNHDRYLQAWEETMSGLIR